MNSQLPCQTFRGLLTLEKIRNKIKEVRPLWSDSEVETEANLAYTRKFQKTIKKMDNQMDMLLSALSTLSMQELSILGHEVQNRLNPAIQKESERLQKELDNLKKLAISIPS